MSIVNSFGSRTNQSLPKEDDQIREEACIKSLTVLESNSDLLRLMRFYMCIESLQIIVKVFPAL